ncbi:hypothetical protein VAR608DRAFT_1331 [Variovorax sp. HW608]|uniref:hypothetical protein n=1 Tax=Variovorax sp. HW608 TaxID=1034889 RepID=UPI00081FCFF2|nr:hypothetical protein [Variovorax sp. HW608]SCK18524.1 hypothetical protein VAR608DRAFT_1331 [Variovorax sp. HW608]
MWAAVCQPGLYTYSIGMIDQPMFMCEDDFDSGEDCLRDAGNLRGKYFDGVRICHAGNALGLIAVKRLRNEPAHLFDEPMDAVLAGCHTRKGSQSLRGQSDEAAGSQAG